MEVSSTCIQHLMKALRTVPSSLKIENNTQVDLPVPADLFGMPLPATIFQVWTTPHPQHDLPGSTAYSQRTSFCSRSLCRCVAHVVCTLVQKTSKQHNTTGKQASQCITCWRRIRQACNTRDKQASMCIVQAVYKANRPTMRHHT